MPFRKGRIAWRAMPMGKERGRNPPRPEGAGPLSPGVIPVLHRPEGPLTLDSRRESALDRLPWVDIGAPDHHIRDV